MNENQKIPRIRFKGFTDTWEQRKFEELFFEKREKTEQEFEDKLLSCAINGIFLNSELFSHFRGTSTIGYLKIKKYDLVLSAQNLHLGNANVNLRFESGIISPAYKVFEINKECEPEFIQAWVKKEDTKQFFLSATTEGASQCRKNIEWNELNKQLVCVPKRGEQVAVGKLIMAIDNLITLHQRKYDKLVATKKALLEKMFPRDGATVPEIRFKGFTDAWEQRELGEFFKKYQNTVYLDDETSYVQVSVRNTGIVEYRDEKKGIQIGRKRQYKIDTENHPDTLVFTRQTVYEGGIGFVPKTLNGAIVTENMPLLDMNGMSKKFVVAFVRTKGYYSRVIDDNTLIGSAQKALHEKLWLASKVIIPKEEEQEKIGCLFEQLDNLITLHQRKLEKLKNIKKSLLEKMFV